jgi:hypothetical protein
MTPKEKLQKKIEDKRLELARAEGRVEELSAEVRIYEATMKDLFGAEPDRRKAGRPTDAEIAQEQEKLLRTLDAAPNEGMSIRQIANKLYGDEFDETIRTRISQRLARGVEKGTVERPSKGRFRIKRNSGPALVQS